MSRPPLTASTPPTSPTANSGISNGTSLNVTGRNGQERVSLRPRGKGITKVNSTDEMMDEDDGDDMGWQGGRRGRGGAETRSKRRNTIGQEERNRRRRGTRDEGGDVNEGKEDDGENEDEDEGEEGQDREGGDDESDEDLPLRKRLRLVEDGDADSRGRGDSEGEGEGKDIDAADGRRGGKRNRIRGYVIARTWQLMTPFERVYYKITMQRGPKVTAAMVEDAAQARGLGHLDLLRFALDQYTRPLRPETKAEAEKRWNRMVMKVGMPAGWIGEDSDDDTMNGGETGDNEDDNDDDGEDDDGGKSAHALATRHSYLLHIIGSTDSYLTGNTMSSSHSEPASTTLSTTTPASLSPPLPPPPSSLDPTSPPLYTSTSSTSSSPTSNSTSLDSSSGINLPSKAPQEDSSNGNNSNAASANPPIPLPGTSSLHGIRSRLVKPLMTMMLELDPDRLVTRGLTPEQIQEWRQKLLEFESVRQRQISDLQAYHGSINDALNQRYEKRKEAVNKVYSDKQTQLVKRMAEEGETGEAGEEMLTLQEEMNGRLLALQFRVRHRLSLESINQKKEMDLFDEHKRMELGYLLQHYADVGAEQPDKRRFQRPNAPSSPAYAKLAKAFAVFKQMKQSEGTKSGNTKSTKGNEATKRRRMKWRIDGSLPEADPVDEPVDKRKRTPVSPPLVEEPKESSSVEQVKLPAKRGRPKGSKNKTHEELTMLEQAVLRRGAHNKEEEESTSVNAVTTIDDDSDDDRPILKRRGRPPKSKSGNEEEPVDTDAKVLRVGLTPAYLNILAALEEEKRAVSAGDINAKQTVKHLTFLKNRPRGVFDSYLAELAKLAPQDFERWYSMGRLGVKGRLYTPAWYEQDITSSVNRFTQLFQSNDLPVNDIISNSHVTSVPLTRLDPFVSLMRDGTRIPCQGLPSTAELEAYLQKKASLAISQEPDISPSLSPSSSPSTVSLASSPSSVSATTPSPPLKPMTDSTVASTQKRTGSTSPTRPPPVSKVSARVKVREQLVKQYKPMPWRVEASAMVRHFLLDDAFHEDSSVDDISPTSSHPTLATDHSNRSTTTDALGHVSSPVPHHDKYPFDHFVRAFDKLSTSITSSEQSSVSTASKFQAQRLATPAVGEVTTNAFTSTHDTPSATTTTTTTTTTPNPPPTHPPSTNLPVSQLSMAMPSSSPTSTTPTPSTATPSPLSTSTSVSLQPSSSSLSSSSLRSQSSTPFLLKSYKSFITSSASHLSDDVVSVTAIPIDTSDDEVELPRSRRSVTAARSSAIDRSPDSLFVGINGEIRRPSQALSAVSHGPRMRRTVAQYPWLRVSKRKRIGDSYQASYIPPMLPPEVIHHVRNEGRHVEALRREAIQVVDGDSMTFLSSSGPVASPRRHWDSRNTAELPSLRTSQPGDQDYEDDDPRLGGIKVNPSEFMDQVKSSRVCPSDDIAPPDSSPNSQRYTQQSEPNLASSPTSYSSASSTHFSLRSISTSFPSLTTITRANQAQSTLTTFFFTDTATNYDVTSATEGSEPVVATTESSMNQAPSMHDGYLMPRHSQCTTLTLTRSSTYPTLSYAFPSLPSPTLTLPSTPWSSSPLPCQCVVVDRFWLPPPSRRAPMSHSLCRFPQHESLEPLDSMRDPSTWLKKLESVAVSSLIGTALALLDGKQLNTLTADALIEAAAAERELLQSILFVFTAPRVPHKPSLSSSTSPSSPPSASSSTHFPIQTPSIPLTRSSAPPMELSPPFPPLRADVLAVVQALQYVSPHLTIHPSSSSSSSSLPTYSPSSPLLPSLISASSSFPSRPLPPLPPSQPTPPTLTSSTTQIEHSSSSENAASSTHTPTVTSPLLPSTRASTPDPTAIVSVELLETLNEAAAALNARVEIVKDKIMDDTPPDLTSAGTISTITPPTTSVPSNNVSQLLCSSPSSSSSTSLSPHRHPQKRASQSLVYTEILRGLIPPPSQATSTLYPRPPSTVMVRAKPINRLLQNAPPIIKDTSISPIGPSSPIPSSNSTVTSSSSSSAFAPPVSLTNATDRGLPPGLIQHFPPLSQHQLAALQLARQYTCAVLAVITAKAVAKWELLRPFPAVQVFPHSCPRHLASKHKHLAWQSTLPVSSPSHTSSTSLSSSFPTNPSSMPRSSLLQIKESNDEDDTSQDSKYLVVKKDDVETYDTELRYQERQDSNKYQGEGEVEVKDEAVKMEDGVQGTSIRGSETSGMKAEKSDGDARMNKVGGKTEESELKQSLSRKEDAKEDKYEDQSFMDVDGCCRLIPSFVFSPVNAERLKLAAQRKILERAQARLRQKRAGRAGLSEETVVLEDDNDDTPHSRDVMAMGRLELMDEDQIAVLAAELSEDEATSGQSSNSTSRRTGYRQRDTQEGTGSREGGSDDSDSDALEYTSTSYRPYSQWDAPVRRRGRPRKGPRGGSSSSSTNSGRPSASPATSPPSLAEDSRQSVEDTRPTTETGQETPQRPASVTGSRGRGRGRGRPRKSTSSSDRGAQVGDDEFHADLVNENEITINSHGTSKQHPAEKEESESSNTTPSDRVHSHLSPPVDGTSDPSAIVLISPALAGLVAIPSAPDTNPTPSINPTPSSKRPDIMTDDNIIT